MATITDESGFTYEIPNTADNRSDDDAGSPSVAGNPDVKSYGGGANSGAEAPTPGSTTDAASVTNSGTSILGKSGKFTLLDGKSPTVKPNPLGYFSSYTYQLTLYMLTADAINAFRASGRTNLNDLVIKNQGSKGGAYIVCQSGGINNTSFNRAPGFDLDYYIDNVTIQGIVAPNTARAPTTSIGINFQIIEPYGFSFISRLKYAYDELQKYGDTLGVPDLKNPVRGYFVLGVRFYGYDKYGNAITGKESFDGRPFNTLGSGNGSFEQFYDIQIKKLNFKIDGKTTVYACEAVTLNQTAQSIKVNNIPTQCSVEATTVEEALTGQTGLITLVNNYWQTLKDTGKMDYAYKFNVEFVGDLDDLKNASIVLPNDQLKWKWPIKRDPNDPVGIEAVPNSNKRLMTFSNTPSMTITAAIEKIVANSSFMNKALKVSYTNDDSPNSQTKDENEIQPDGVKYFRWFNITTNVKILGYSKFINDWVYEITFVLCPYETPIVLSPYIKDLPKYYGPHKRYEYWFTGKNTEVISYEQQNNYGFFIVALDPKLNSQNNTNGSVNIPISPNFQTDSDKTGGLYAKNEAQGSITSNLYDPRSQATAKLTILGDPDFLMQDSLNYEPGTKKFNQFYAPNGYTINPTGGQIFIEIFFKEGVDYNYNTGTMDINDSITFFQYPEIVKKIVKGVSYQIVKLNSNFKGGKFTQDLECIINQFGRDGSTYAQLSNQREEEPDAVVVSGPAFGQAGAGRGAANPGTRSATGSPGTSTGNTTSTNTGLRENQSIAESSPAPTSAPAENPDDPGTANNVPTQEDSGRE